MPLSKEQVERIAQLARLNLSPNETAELAEELVIILDYVGQLRSVDTKGVEPCSQSPESEDVLRDDESHPSLARDKVLANAPVEDNGYFCVPRVIG
jgi:aspartyl-tRNA(Asn)/glutamyl-tRNA(Gln) amidotransferase subunit C